MLASFSASCCLEVDRRLTTNQRLLVIREYRFEFRSPDSHLILLDKIIDTGLFVCSAFPSEFHNAEVCGTVFEFYFFKT